MRHRRALWGKCAENRSLSYHKMTEARENCGRICSTKRVKKVGPRLPELAPAARGSQKVGSGNLGHTFLPAQYVSRALGCLQSFPPTQTSWIGFNVKYEKWSFNQSPAFVAISQIGPAELRTSSGFIAYHSKCNRWWAKWSSRIEDKFRIHRLSLAILNYWTLSVSQIAEFPLILVTL